MRKFTNFLFPALVILCVFFRFYNYWERYGIGYDGSRDALVAFESARQLQLPLTGSFSSIGPITFGPLYYWYITFSTFLIPSMWAPWIAIGLASVAMSVAMYAIGRLLHNHSFGLTLLFFAAVSPAQILSSMQLQQHALIGFLSSLGILLLILLIRYPKQGVFAFSWGFVLGFAFNTHFQSAGLFTLPVLYIIIMGRIRFLPRFLLGLFASLVPILIFELNNHWFNTRNILDYIFIGQYRVWTSNRWLTFAGTFFPDFWSYATGLPVFAVRTIIVTLLFLACWMIYKRRISRAWVIILGSFFIQVIMLRYYRGEKFFGYLQFFHPYLFLFTGFLIFRILRKFSHPIFPVILFAALLYFIIPKSISSMAPDRFTRETHARIDVLRSRFPGNTFAVSKCKDIYDTGRPQGLLLSLYQRKLYNPLGKIITIENKNCAIAGEYLTGNMLAVSASDAAVLEKAGLTGFSPEMVWADTARWWFTEQP